MKNNSKIGDFSIIKIQKRC
ncbi:hypothetical protein GXP75_05465 [Bacillus sp. HU-1818]|nr:hypothetical protein [Bacillus sp. ISL-32]MCI3195120.1 hypothetical protein [Bacillus sp. HU-1818]